MLQRLAWLWTVCLWCYKALFRRGRPTPQPQEAGHEPVAEPYTGPESAPAAPATTDRGLRGWAVRLLTAGVRRWLPLVQRWREMKVRAVARRGARLPRLWPAPKSPRPVRRRPSVRPSLEGLEGRLVASVLAAGQADPNAGPALFAYVNTTTPDRKDFALSTDGDRG